MCYSLDLRKKVISFIENGNSITKAVRIFGTSTEPPCTGGWINPI